MVILNSFWHSCRGVIHIWRKNYYIYVYLECKLQLCNEQHSLSSEHKPKNLVTVILPMLHKYTYIEFCIILCSTSIFRFGQYYIKNSCNSMVLWNGYLFYSIFLLLSPLKYQCSLFYLLRSDKYSFTLTMGNCLKDWRKHSTIKTLW